ncbi:MAG: hypothetical protein CMC40_01420 [Flavobacteriaceae bacterium]|nr:hypothetical protein [Flavobacteriaceae bacterium]|tara:strand:+ start:1835 stop:2377 length:543 start_codon:yes stop_codon:yes gene_type:complete
MINSIISTLIILFIFQSSTYTNEYPIKIEITQGTIEKWEYNFKSGKLEQDFENLKPRSINYMPYPFNYGFILNTFNKFDSDPLDAVVIGEKLNMSDTIFAKPIAVVKTIDNGEIDDKVIFIHKSSPLYKIDNKIDLQNSYPGVIEIICLFFENYKGKSSNVIGVKDENYAKKLIISKKIN